MKIILPSFIDKYGLLLSVCGEVNVDTIKKPNKRTSEAKKIASFRRGSNQGFIRAWIVERKAPCLHVDCAHKKAFSEIPKVTHKQSDILKLIERFFGFSMKAVIKGIFKLPKEDLARDGLISALTTLQSVTGDVSIKTTGSTFQLSGVPISEINWREVKEETESVFISLKGKTQITISESYLAESWEWIRQQFDIFILGKN